MCAFPILSDIAGPTQLMIQPSLMISLDLHPSYSEVAQFSHLLGMTQTGVSLPFLVTTNRINPCLINQKINITNSSYLF